MTTHPLYWLKQLQGEISAQKKIPLWGEPPSFPWESYCDALKKALDIPELRIEPIKTDFLLPDQFLQSFGSKPHILALELAPLSGPLFWILSDESVAKLVNLLLAHQPLNKGFTDRRFQEGFYQYLMLQAIQSFDQLGPFASLQPQILEPCEFPSEQAFATDISLFVHEHTFTARLLYSPSFQESFSAHFKKESTDIFSNELSQQLDLFLSLEVGYCSLSQEEWDDVKVGDFVILDRCSYDPLLQKGTATLGLNSHPLFKIKLKKNTLKVLDYAFYHGEEKNMDEEYKEEPEAEPLSDEEMNIEEESSYAEHEEDFVEESEHLWSAAAETGPRSDALFSPKDIPLNLVVEVDRIRMNLHKLMQLQPGNVLELAVRPEQGVYLTVNGKKVAKAELLKLGEILGVKILEVGDGSSS